MKLQRRIAVHFTFQFIILFVALFFLVILLMVFLAGLMAREEMKLNIQTGLIENIPGSVIIKNDEVTIDDKWPKLIKQNDMWIQIINSDGNVIYSVNTPDHLQNKYTINDLLRIEEVSKIEEYEVSTHYESWLTDPHYYLFGYYNPAKKLLDEWFERYERDGIVDANQLELFNNELITKDGFIQIYKEGEMIQTVGQLENTPTKTLELIARKHEPGKYAIDVAHHIDSESGTSWILYIPKKESEKTIWLLPDKDTQIFLLAGLVSLVIAILFSIWNGYRYGRPLLMMVNWIDRIEDEQFADVLTEKEKKKIFKKSGKTRRRYRLYQEVIQAFNTMAKKLHIAKQERLQLERTREEWMAGISHDLRTPLSTIQGYAHLLESSKYNFSTDETIEIGKTMREKGDYIVQLVNDFSLVFELKNNAIHLEKQEVDLNLFVKNSVEDFKRDLTIQHAQFTFSGTFQPLYAYIDPKWFIRVLDNVIYNAVKHNPVDTLIEVILLRKENDILIQIKDHGKGMNEQSIKNIFDRYYRGTNTKERTDGAGLGMNIAKGIVELHNGTISVQSTVGKGTMITISLPLESQDTNDQ